MKDAEVEAVAKAICLAGFGDEKTHGDGRCCQAGGSEGCCWESLKSSARAAIRAMNAAKRDLTNMEAGE
jgi:hypothetical protein